MQWLARNTALGGLAIFLAGGAILFCGVVIIRAAHTHLGRD